MDRIRSTLRLLPLAFLAVAVLFTPDPAGAQTIPGHIRGTVFASNISPIEGARVEAFISMTTADSTNPIFVTTTDPEGRYDLAAPHRGCYMVRASAPGFEPQIYGLGPSNVPPCVPIAPGEVVQGIDFHLRRAGAIRGRVTDGVTGAPIAGALVSAWPAPNDSLAPPGDPVPAGTDPSTPGLGSAITGANGEYVIAGLQPGSYLVMARAERYLPQYFDGASRYEDATPVQVFDGRETTGIDFALSRGGRIEGTITAAGSGEPVPGASVMFTPLGPDSTMPGDPTPPVIGVGRVMADSTGRYAIEGLPSGRYIVFADAPGFMQTFFGGSTDPNEAVPVVVHAPQATTRIDIALAQGGSIAGRVTDATTGAPIAGARVELYLPYMGPSTDNAGPRPGPGAVTDEHGHYRIEGIPTGRYILFCSAIEQGYESEFYQDAHTPADATPVAVEAPHETGGIDFALVRHGPNRGEITGRVSSAAGDTIPGAVVVAVSLAGQAGFATTGPDGLYAIRGLAPGSYYVFAAATGYVGEFYDGALGWEDATPVEVNGSVGGIDFALNAQAVGPGVIVGRVTDGSGGGVAQAWVYAEPVGSGVRGFTTTGGDGTYMLSGLAPGSYRIRATCVGSASRYYGGATGEQAAIVDVTDGTIRDVNIVLSEDGAPMGAPGLRVIGNAPNPFRRATTIAFTLDRAGENVTVDIFDIRGRRVRRIEAHGGAAGRQEIAWDGRDGSGRAAPAGYYVYRVSADGKSAAGQMLLVD